MYETLTYTGGIHKHEEMTELIEDLEVLYFKKILVRWTLCSHWLYQ